MFQTKIPSFQFIHFRGTKRLFPSSRIDCCCLPQRLENRFKITTEKKEAVAEIRGVWGARVPQSATSSENSGFRRIIDNCLTCRNYSKKSFGKGF